MHRKYILTSSGARGPGWGGTPRCVKLIVFGFCWVGSPFPSYPPPPQISSLKTSIFILVMTSYVLVLPSHHVIIFLTQHIISTYFFICLIQKKKNVIFLSWANTTYRPRYRPDNTHLTSSFLSPPPPKTSPSPKGLHFFFLGGGKGFGLVDKCRVWMKNWTS